MDKLFWLPTSDLGLFVILSRILASFSELVNDCKTVSTPKFPRFVTRFTYSPESHFLFYHLNQLAVYKKLGDVAMTPYIIAVATRRLHIWGDGFATLPTADKKEMGRGCG